MLSSLRTSLSTSASVRRAERHSFCGRSKNSRRFHFLVRRVISTVRIQGSAVENNVLVAARSNSQRVEVEEWPDSDAKKKMRLCHFVIDADPHYFGELYTLCGVLVYSVLYTGQCPRYSIAGLVPLHLSTLSSESTYNIIISPL